MKYWKYQIQKSIGIPTPINGDLGWDEFKCYGTSFSDSAAIKKFIMVMAAYEEYDDVTWRIIKWPLKAGRWAPPGSVKVLMEGTVIGGHIVVYPKTDMHSRVDTWFPKHDVPRFHGKGHETGKVSLSNDPRANPKNRDFALRA